MKKIYFLLFICNLLFAQSCSKQNSAPSQDEMEAYQEAISNASKSEIIENNFFGGFQIGMTEEQVDSVIGVMYSKFELTHFIDKINCPSGYATIRERDEFSIDNSYYTLWKGDTIFYISFHPSYFNGKLSQLLCTAECMNKAMGAKDITDILIKLFDEANADKSFLPFRLPDGSSARIKDNLCILFFPQPDLPKGSMQYVNMPEADSLYSQEEHSKEDPFST